ncbi:MAG: RICIN domain-containing protein [Ktedonobacteraceae bacterium]|nr:RICIN domain-containing protein [Ktedonobacteraceae bacterium]
MFKNRRSIAVGLLLISLVAIAVVRPFNAKAASALGSNWYGAAPYVMPLANNPPGLTNVMSATGAKAFTLAFVVANGGCTPAWESDAGLDNVSSDTQVAPIINGVRSAGGDVVVSFGGYGGTKLGETCGSAQATANAEQTVISKYGLNAIDLDLEEPEYENTNAINNELGAAKILQANNPNLYISITIPGTTSGTGYFGQSLLTAAKTLGFTPNNFGIMPFDGGFNGANSQISALQSFNTILMNTFGWSSSTAYAHEGFSGMNGRTDSAEYFYQADFQTVLTFAESNHLARYTFWALNRDRQCNPVDNNGTLSGTCSSVAQGDWDFTKIVVQFAGAGGTTGYTYIKNRYSGKVLDDTGWSTSNGTTIEQWDEGNGQANQQWSLVSTGDGYYYIQNRYSGKVLDDTGWSTSNGTTIEQWDKGNGQANQQWSLIGV